MLTADLSLTKSLRSLYQEGHHFPLSLSLPKGTDISLIYAKGAQANNESKNGLLLPGAPGNQR